MFDVIATARIVPYRVSSPKAESSFWKL